MRSRALQPPSRIAVGAARGRYKIPYPSLYAVPGTPRRYGAGDSRNDKEMMEASPLITEEEAYNFNCVQRGHQVRTGLGKHGCRGCGPGGAG